MKIFVTGASGYIGGSVAARLMEAGHQVCGLVRDDAKAARLSATGIEPVLGDLEDLEVLARAARGADAVVNAANADHRPSLEAMVDALAGSGKALVHTSGSSVIGDDARGSRVADAIFDEQTPFVVEPTKQARHALNQSLLAASHRQVRSVVICPSLIYGVGKGLNPHSIQVPFLVDQARANGTVRVVGAGLNRWSNVHIEDLEDLYLRALDAAPPGSFYFAENGEASFAEIGQSIAHRLNMGTVQSWPAEQAAREWGVPKAYYTFGSNSRVRAVRARAELGWSPRHDSVLGWIRNEMPL